MVTGNLIRIDKINLDGLNQKIKEAKEEYDHYLNIKREYPKVLLHITKKLKESFPEFKITKAKITEHGSLYVWGNLKEFGHIQTDICYFNDVYEKTKFKGNFYICNSNDGVCWRSDMYR